VYGVAALMVATIVVGCMNNSLLTDFGRASISDKPTGNHYCFVCHGNYRKEKFAGIHDKVGIGCATCHGPSYDHLEDEEHIIPPDIMFPRNMINGSCLACHNDAALRTVEDHAEFYGNPGKYVCTDCHGKTHRLEKRDVRWNKVTREVIND